MYQLIIIGAGPAGMTAGLFAQRYKINHLIIGQEIGGAINDAHIIENYPGFKSITPEDLVEKIRQSVKSEIKQEIVKKVAREKSKTGNFFNITTNQGKHETESLILAVGMKNRRLNFTNENKFINQGISYGVPDDISAFKDKTVAVVGGGDSALDAALKISEPAKKVYLIHRRDEFRGAPVLVERVVKNKKIEIIYSGEVKEAQGKGEIEKIVLNNRQELVINHLLIEIGGVPNTNLCQGINVEMEGNFIKTDKSQNTNIPGIFAAGDLTNNSAKLIVTAASEGAIAATSAYKYLLSKRNS